MNTKKETTRQRKRRLEKAKLKRQEKISNESDVHKRQRLEKNKGVMSAGTSPDMGTLLARRQSAPAPACLGTRVTRIAGRCARGDVSAS
ncbi:hypothetical protein EVAR_60483_1 [Eumeta japonica]|uniref:Uncharacterized protein n=1 Tax=Eumeta variegata TaxID=151549 RepID=A0A4C1ZTK3_EUMVA|nr:hypothetical protein EVAR_60483_1 [Eumeta japonica]